MTRVARAPSDLGLLAALRALGPAPSWRELISVAEALRESDDTEVHELLGGWPPDDHRQQWESLYRIAEAAGAGGLVALDLATAFQSPGIFDELARAPAVFFDEGRL